MRIGLSLSVLLVALTVGALGCPARAIGDYPLSRESFPTLEGAVEAAFHTGLILSRQYEVGGIIFVQHGSGLYKYSLPVTSHDPENLSLHYWGAYDGYAQVGDYHTHPCSGDIESNLYFSDTDTAGNKRMHLLGYMLDECTGLVHVFNPLYDRTAADGETPGRIVEGVKIQ